MSRKWDYAQKPVQCANCANFSDGICTADGFSVTSPLNWRFCTDFLSLDGESNNVIHYNRNTNRVTRPRSDSQAP